MGSQRVEHDLVTDEQQNYSHKYMQPPSSCQFKNIFITCIRHPVSFSKDNLFLSSSSNHVVASAAAKLLQLCLTLCNPINGSPPGSPFLGILQARTLEWVAIFSSNTWKWKVKVKSFYPLWLFATPWGFPGKSAGVGCHCLLHPPAIRSTNLFSVFIDLSAANIYRKWNDKMAMLLWLASFT